MGPASSLGEEPYHATGTALDYMYSKLGVRRSFMIETFGFSTLYGARNRDQKRIDRPPAAAASPLDNPPEEPTSSEENADRPTDGALVEPPILASAPLVAVEQERRNALSTLQRLLEGLAPSERAYDCVSYFNPTSQHTYERTVSAWADALLVLVDESTLTPEEAAARR